MGDSRATARRSAVSGWRRCRALGSLQESPLYRTEPVGDVPQDWFLNQVVELRTYLDPVRLLGETQLIEEPLGRESLEKRQRWGPRPIDIDMVLVR